MGRRAIVPDREWNVLLEQRAVLHLPDRYEREHDRAAQLRAVPGPRGSLGKLGRAQGPERGADGPVAGVDRPAVSVQPDDDLRWTGVRPADATIRPGRPGD